VLIREPLNMKELELTVDDHLRASGSRRECHHAAPRRRGRICGAADTCGTRTPSLASVRGAASAQEARVLKGDAEVLGHGLTEAVLGAAQSAALRLPDEAIDDVYCDINGERYRTDEWAFTMLRASHVVRDATYSIATSSWGDVGAASGALGCILAARAWARDYAKGPRALVWGSSEGGLRAAVVLEQAKRR